MKPTLQCILLNPCFSYAQGSIYKAVSSYDPPLGLAQLSAFLNEHGYTTHVYDLNVEIDSHDDFPILIDKIKDIYHLGNPLIGIPFITTFLNSSYDLAAKVKKMFPDSTILAGGAHSTFMPAEILRSGNVDIAIRGEGEYSLLDIISGKPLPSIKGISYRKVEGAETKTIHNETRERIKNINKLPMPAYDQLRLNKYRPVLGSYKSLPATNMVTSRGCPGKCRFCCRTLGHFTTLLSAEKMYHEILHLMKHHNIKQINFYDDTFTLKKSRIHKLCDLLIENKIKLDWTCFSRVDTVDEPLLKKMKKAGCYQIMYGVENFDSKIIQEINKNISVTQVENVIKLTKKYKIECRISLLIGNPGDTKLTIKNNLKMAKKLNPDILVVNITTPFPGTDFFQWATSENRLLTKDWSQYDGKQAVMKIDGLTPAEIYKLYHHMYFRYYFRLRYIFSRFTSIRNLTMLKVSTLGFFKLFRFILKRHFGRQ